LLVPPLAASRTPVTPGVISPPSVYVTALSLVKSIYIVPAVANAFAVVAAAALWASTTDQAAPS
jgi:hypothetical protein